MKKLIIILFLILFSSAIFAQIIPQSSDYEIPEIKIVAFYQWGEIGAMIFSIDGNLFIAISGSGTAQILIEKDGKLVPMKLELKTKEKI